MSEGNMSSFIVNGVVLCPTCHKPTMYIGDPPGPELCDCWNKVKHLLDVPVSDRVYVKAEDVIGLREYIFRIIGEVLNANMLKTKPVAGETEIGYEVSRSIERRK